MANVKVEYVNDNNIDGRMGLQKCLEAHIQFLKNIKKYESKAFACF